PDEPPRPASPVVPADPTLTPVPVVPPLPIVPAVPGPAVPAVAPPPLVPASPEVPAVPVSPAGSELAQPAMASAATRETKTQVELRKRWRGIGIWNSGTVACGSAVGRNL